MTRVLITRLLQLVPVFFGATFLLFAMVYLLPGDPISALGGGKKLAPNVVANLRRQYHLDQPFVMQYWYYLKGIFTFDFGTSYSGRPVSAMLAEKFPVTVRLALLAGAVELLGGVALGTVSGLRKGRWFDSTVLFASLVIIAVPIFVIGLVAQFVLGVEWGIAPVTIGSDASWGRLFVPGVVLGLVSLAYVVRLTRDSVSEVADAEYVRTATAKGLSRGRVVVVHILRNSLIPVITFVGADIGALMGGAVVTEGIFNINGVGNAIYQGVVRGESGTVVSFVTVIIVVYLLANLVVDLLYALLDPRIRRAS
ncbi:MAG: ABC transporter permease [Segniliparus sp.]|uniref:ABC transporter permease n=1 Tax=Segniliparus sp. TaxID=2804064 RepID=UPI003F3DA5AB